jgi:4-amino-4-deoxy-L-arabinose transferase-like glycosyltransferase
MQYPRKKEFCGHLVVSLVAVLIFLANISHSGLWFPDAPSHALNGVFYKDMIEEMGFLNPTTYAERYYVQYPILTVGMYPPVFYTTEAFFFKVFGIYPLVPKLAVISFTLLGVNAFFLLCRLWFPVGLSTVASILYLLQPSTLFGQRNVMLEMPALAVSTIALYYLYIGTEKGKRWALFLAPLFAALAFLTKQNTIFLIPVWLVWIIARKKWAPLKSGYFILGLVTGLFILVPWVTVNLTVGRFYTTAFAFQEYHIWSRCLYYLRHATEVMSYPVIILSALSAVMFTKLRKNGGYIFALIWALCVVLSVLLMRYPEPRYAMSVIPAVIILSMYVVCFFKELFNSFFQRRYVYSMAVIALIFLHLTPEKIWARRDVRGIDQAAAFVVSDLDCVSVLYDGYFNGNFVFHVRAKDSDRRLFVFRASKAIFSTKMLPELGYNELVDQVSQFHDLLHRYSIKYIVQEEEDSLRTPANTRLRQWVKEPEFRLVKRYPVRSRGLRGAIGSLLVYEYLRYKKRPIRRIDLDMPMIGRKMSVRIQAEN